MDNFKTFLEDLASGRPAKKPVSSNLLKQRAKDNEKALKSGFMKMPDYVKKKFNEEEEKDYNPDKEHTMNPTSHVKKEGDKFCVYNMKGKKVASFDTKPQADAYAKKNHDQLMKEEKKNCGCGQDPCITYGKKQMKEAKKPVVHSDKPDSLKMVKIKYNKPIKTKVTDIGPGGKEVVRKNWSESTRDKYNPVISDKRNKEKMAKVGLPAGKGPLVQEEKQKGVDGKVCWKGYKRMGTKKKGGKTVDNCVKVEDFVLDAFENYYLTELSPKTISSYQKKAGSQYRSLRKTTPSHQDSENAYHQGYTSDKEYFKQHDDRDKMKKRGKGLAMSKGKGVQKEGAMKRLATDREESERLRDKAHAKLGYKKTADTGLQKVKGGYERKRTYTREEQMQLVTNLDLDESIANLVRRGVGKVQKAISDAEKNTGYKVDPAKRNIPNPVSGDNIAKRLYGKSQKKR